MGKTFTALIPVILAACASRPTAPAVASALPPASFAQVSILLTARTVHGVVPSNPAPEATPGVIDLQAALKATPEARELRSKRYAEDGPEYHVLITRANERLWNAIRRVSTRRCLGFVMERGNVLLKPEFTHVAVADITEEVAYEVSRK